MSEAEPQHKELYDEELSTGAGDGFVMTPASTSGRTVVSTFKDYRRKQREKSASKKGYVRWYLVDDFISAPKYVKPECTDGGDIPEFEYKGETYLFPRSAMVPDEKDGIWTVVHREGQAEPMDLRNGNEDSIPAHALQEYLEMKVTDTNPSGWSLPGLDGITPQQMMLGLIGIIVLYAVLSGGI